MDDKEFRELPQLTELGASDYIPVQAASTNETSYINPSDAKQYFNPTEASELMYNFIVAGGCVWSGDSYGSSPNASMTAGVCYIAGKRLTVPAVAARPFTLSRNTYVDFKDNGDGTASINYTEVSLNAASPALAGAGTTADTIRNAIITTDAADIQDVGNINQGQREKLIPIASSIPYQTTDSLGNLIYPTDPQRRVLGYRQFLSDASTATQARITELRVPFIMPTVGRRITAEFWCSALVNTTSGSSAEATIYDGVAYSGTQLAKAAFQTASNSQRAPASVKASNIVPSVASNSYEAGINALVTSFAVAAASSTSPGYLKIYLE